LENKEYETYTRLRTEGIKLNSKGKKRKLRNNKRNMNNKKKNKRTIKASKHINRQESFGSRECVKVDLIG
jgi:hypothetical protein